MFLFNVVILCCVFMLHRKSCESEALIVYDPRSRYYSYNLARGGYGRYYDQEKIKIYSSASSTAAKKTTHKHSTPRPKSHPSIDLSFEPLGALKIDSLTHGELEFNPEALDDVLLAIASGTLSMVPDFYQYMPSLSSFYGTEPATESSPDESSRPGKRHRHRGSDQDDASEEKDPSGENSDLDDNSEKSHKTDENSSTKHHDDDDDSKPDESSTHHHDEDDGDNAAEEHDDDDASKANKSNPAGSSEHKNHSEEGKSQPASENKHSKETSKEPAKNSKETGLETGAEVPIEGLPAQEEGYVGKFVKYYSYAKPLAKAASLFVPGLGQYRGVMFGLEMADLAYQTATMYQNGDGFMSIGWHLGKEAFSKLGRRSVEPMSAQEHSDTTTSSMDFEKFLDEVKNTQYPSLDDKTERKIKTSVIKIVRKYFHDLEEYKNKSKRTEFINLMISCVKFIALRKIIPESDT